MSPERTAGTEFNYAAKPRVFLTVPNGDSTVHKSVAMRVIELINDKRCEVTASMPTHRPFVNNLHHCLNEFMGGNYDYWLTIDSDNPPIGTPLDLIENDLDVVGFPTPVFNDSQPETWPWYFNAYKWVSAKGEYTPMAGEGLTEVDAVGTGCVLFSRRVFRRPTMRNAPFARMWHLDGTVNVGNDLAFCHRAKAVGLEIWCDFNRPCRHFIRTDLTSLIERVGEMAYGIGPDQSGHRTPG